MGYGDTPQVGGPEGDLEMADGERIAGTPPRRPWIERDRIATKERGTMAWYRNLRLAPKLIGSFVLVAMLATIVGLVGFTGFRTMQSNLDWITSNSSPSLVYLLKAQGDVNSA